MGFLGDIFGGGGGGKVAQAQLDRPVTTAQVDQQFAQAQSALQQQQAFVNALQAQNGIGNLQSAYQQALRGSQGLGPNPALAQLAQQTQANTANQAALMAGARGASMSPGMIARLAAQQGSANQQNAIGQAATLSAQQQLAQQQLASQIAGQQAGMQQTGVENLAGNNLNLYGQQLNQINAQNNQALGQASQINNANEAYNNRQSNMFGGLLNAAGTIGGLMLGGPAGAVAGNALTSQFSGNEGTVGTQAMPATRNQQLTPGFSEGGKVPGQAKMPGDSKANDTVHAKLSPGEIVIPRSVLESADPVAAAAAFVQQTLGHPKKKVDNAYFDGGQVLDWAKQGIGGAINSFIPGMGAVAEVATRDKPIEEPIQNISQPEVLPEPINQQAISPSIEMAQPKPIDPYAQLKSGIQAEANAVSGREKELQSHYAQQEQQMMDIQKRTDANMAQLQMKRDQLINDINEQKIDPNRYTSSLGTGGKVMTAIGLLLSGVGAGLTGKENMAAQFLQKNIDNDIEAQKAELGKKQNLLSQNLQEFGNIKDAAIMTRSQLMDITANQIAKTAAKFNDPMAKARAEQEIGKLNAASLQLQQQVAAQKAQQQALGLKYPDKYASSKDSVIERLIPGLGATAGTKEDASIIKKKVGPALAAQDKMSQLIELSKRGDVAVPGTESYNLAKSLADQVKGSLREDILGPGTVTEAERKILTNALGDPTELFSLKGNTLAKLKQIQRNSINSMNKELETYGVDARLQVPKERPSLEALKEKYSKKGK